MISLESKITPGFLIRFTLPTVVMMVFNSFYTMVDGGFVSNFAGTNALSAINIVFPIINLVLAVGIMLASGGSAVVATQLGEKKAEKARKSFSLIVLVGVLFGIIFAVIGMVFTKEIVIALGADEAVYQYGYDYAFYMSMFAPFAILQILFQFFFVTAGKPHLGLICTIVGGVSNIVFDYILIVPLDMGIKGAAIATGIGFIIPAVTGMIYFSLGRKRELRFARPGFDLQVILKTCTNGSSEMVSNLSVAITTYLFNYMMMKYLGADGVAAITIVLYAQYLFTAVFLGYTSGIAPLFSYNYGAKNKARLQKLFRMSNISVAVCSVAACALSILLANVVVQIFAKQGTVVYDLAIHGMYLFAPGFLFMGFNIFASGLFTSLSNGKISAILSFLRTFAFIVAAIAFLPMVLQVDGIWLSIPAAEFLAVLVAVWFMVRYQKVYEY